MKDGGLSIKKTVHHSGGQFFYGDVVKRYSILPLSFRMFIKRQGMPFFERLLSEDGKINASVSAMF